MPISIDSAAEVYRDAVRAAVRRFWLLYLGQAAILSLAGLTALIFPVFSTQALMLVLGWLLILSGAVQAGGLIFGRHTPDVWLQLISAILALLIGFLFLRNPEQSLVTFSLLIVVFFMIEGVARLVWAMTIRPLPGWLYVLLSGILGVALSIVLIINLETTAAWLLAVLVGIQLLGAGAALGYVAWMVRQKAKLPAV